MGLSFRRRITILPGVRLNFSNGGVSLSLGPRGASVTFGKRGVYGNVGIPGTGMSYRQRLDSPSASSSRSVSIPSRTSDPDYEVDYTSLQPTAKPSPEEYLRGILGSRREGGVDWQEQALWLAEQAPDPDVDQDAFDLHARRVAQALLARRVLEPDAAAWNEVLHDRLRVTRKDVVAGYELEIDEQTHRVYVAVELLPPEWLFIAADLPTMKRRAFYEDVCCAMLLRYAHDVFQAIPAITDVHLTGHRTARSPETGQLIREIYLRLATDRESFGELKLDYVDPSACFEALGGAKKLKRGELQGIATEPHPDSVEGRIAKIRSIASTTRATLPCPCGHVIEATVAEFRRSPGRQCPACQRELSADLTNAEQQLRELEAKIRAVPDLD